MASTETAHPMHRLHVTLHSIRRSKDNIRAVQLNDIPINSSEGQTKEI